MAELSLAGEIGPALALAGASLAAALGSVQASGWFPATARPATLAGPAGSLLAWLLVAAILGLAAAAVWFALARLSWPAAVIAGGLGLLAGPLAWQAIPRGWLERPGGALVLAATLSLIAALLAGSAHALAA